MSYEDYRIELATFLIDNHATDIVFNGWAVTFVSRKGFKLKILFDDGVHVYELRNGKYSTLHICWDWDFFVLEDILR